MEMWNVVYNYKTLVFSTSFMKIVVLSRAAQLGLVIAMCSHSSDPMAIVLYIGTSLKTINKSERVCTFQKLTSAEQTAEHADFLVGVSDSSHLANSDSEDLQEAVDCLYLTTS